MRNTVQMAFNCIGTGKEEKLKHVMSATGKRKSHYAELVLSSSEATSHVE